MRGLGITLCFLLFFLSCSKFEWNNPYDSASDKSLFTPSGASAEMQGNAVKLTWSQSNDKISGFTLLRSAAGESITNLTQVQKTTLQYVDAAVTAGKKYTYYILAVAGSNSSDTLKVDITPVFPVGVNTGSVTEIAATSAKVSGEITNTGGGTVSSRGICWSATPSPTVSGSKTTESTGSGAFVSSLTGLQAGTTYYARAYGENSRGVSYGSEVTFTTLGPPKLTTTAVTNITTTEATSGGTISSDGGSPITAKGVVWGISSNPTIDLSTKTNDGTGIGSYTSKLTGLASNTQYYVRSYATNALGTSYGDEKIFTASALILASLSQGLIAYYPFTGNADDSSGNNNHGTVNGAVLTTDRFEKLNKAYQFDGVNDYIDIQYNSSIHGAVGTINVWIKTNGFLNNQRLVIGQPNGRPQLVVTPDIPPSKYKARIQWRTTDGNFPGVNSNSDVSNSNWVMITGVYSQSSFKIYINGIFESISNNNQPQDNCSTSNFQIGGFNPTAGCGNILGFTQMFNGVIDDIRIYNRALTEAEITYLANN